MNTLKQRLKKRGTETSFSVENRLKRAEEEMSFAQNFDYLVVNDDLETAYKEVEAIIKPFITD
jgi:guanylate kinase